MWAQVDVSALVAIATHSECRQPLRAPVGVSIGARTATAVASGRRGEHLPKTGGSPTEGAVLAVPKTSASVDGEGRILVLVKWTKTPNFFSRFSACIQVAVDNELDCVSTHGATSYQ